LPVGEEAEVADAHEAAWQQVEQEAAQELILLPWAESRQRKTTFPLARATNLHFGQCRFRHEL
jgi:hypothetical protein